MSMAHASPTIIPATMRAAVLVAPGQFEVRQVPVPQLGPADVLVRVTRCGLCGTDMHIYHGTYSADRLPLIPGHEFSGHIAALGGEVTGLALGQAALLPHHPQQHDGQKQAQVFAREQAYRYQQPQPECGPAAARVA